VLGDAMITTVFDWPLRYSHVIPIKGSSYRVRADPCSDRLEKPQPVGSDHRLRRLLRNLAQSMHESELVIAPTRTPMKTARKCPLERVGNEIKRQPDSTP
jgi:hypothetical protein